MRRSQLIHQLIINIRHSIQVQNIPNDSGCLLRGFQTRLVYVQSSD